MSLEAEIAAVLANPNGVVRASTSNVYTGSEFLRPDMALRMDTICWNARVNVTADAFEITALAPNTNGANHMIIGNEGGVGAIGQLNSTGILYSEDFSGCIWFLFRDNYGSVYGVHAYRQSGRYPDPMPYFNRLGCRLLYVFSTAGHFAPGNFGTVICNVMATRIVIDFVELNNRKMVKVVDHTVINNWRGAPAIPVPALGANLGSANWDQHAPPQPRQSGLKARVARLAIRYI